MHVIGTILSIALVFALIGLLTGNRALLSAALNVIITFILLAISFIVILGAIIGLISLVVS